MKILLKVIHLEVNLLKFDGNFIEENMLSNSSTALHRSNVKILFERLFSTPDSAIEYAPAHQVRLWLDKVRLELTRERNRGKIEHYRYDMNRHIALAAARNALAMRLKVLEK